MPEMNQYAPGAFCWVELATSDQAAAKTFYTSLFGWTYVDNPMGEMGVYTMLKRDGRDVGALYQKGKEQEGVPPNWLSYVSVADADATAARIGELGGTLMMPPFDVFDFGRMCVASDPTGGVFAIWQPKAHFGAGVMGDPGSFCWNELQTTDVEKAVAFYTGVFGWTTKTDSSGGEYAYTELANQGRPNGGMMKIGPHMAGAPPHWLVYFAVADCDASVARATELGANVFVPPMDIPKVGRFSVLADPQGAVFSVIKLDLQQH
jgi:uncharacterized protein